MKISPETANLVSPDRGGYPYQNHEGIVFKPEISFPRIKPQNRKKPGNRPFPDPNFVQDLYSISFFGLKTQKNRVFFFKKTL